MGTCYFLSQPTVSCPRSPCTVTPGTHTYGGRANYALELKRDFANPDSATVGTEFVGTSITSGGDGSDMTDQGQQFLAANPRLKFFNSQRGYVRVTVDQKQWRSDCRGVPFVQTQGAPISTRATYVVEDRNPHGHAS